MAKLHRKELKHDEIRDKMTEAVKSVSIHGREVLYMITAVLAVGFIAFAWFYYQQKQQEQSQNLLGMAMDKFHADVGDQPTDPNASKRTYHYKTEAEKYTDALKDFEQVSQKYGNTPASDIARYEAGICAFYLKNYSKAEQYLKQSSAVSDRNILYYQSRIALANLYNLTGKSDQSVSILNQAVDKNKNLLIPQEYLLMQVAESYEKAGKKKEATEQLQKILDQYKDSPLSYQAQIHLNELKRNDNSQ